MRPITLIPLLLALSLSCGASTAESPYQKRLASVEALRDALLRVADEKGKSDEISALRSDINSSIRQAQALAGSGDETGGKRELDQVYGRIVAEIQLLHGGDTVSEERKPQDDYLPPSDTAKESKVQMDFNRRLDSVNALLEADERVSRERHDAGADEMQRQARELVSAGMAEAGGGDPKAGLAFLDQAYALVKEHLISMRDHQTLVNELDFATPSAEYDYYVGKTGSQLEAIDMLQARIQGQENSAQVARIVDESRGLMAQAAELAGRGDYGEANAIMEQALNRLQNALMTSAAGL